MYLQIQILRQSIGIYWFIFLNVEIRLTLHNFDYVPNVK